MKTLFSILIIITTTWGSFAQNVSIYEDFADNRNGWYKPDNSINVSYGKNNLHLTHIKDDNVGYVGLLNPTFFDQSYDFVIETRQTLKSGATGNGIIFNFKDKENFCKFLITDRDGQYSIWQYTNGTSKSLTGWSGASSIKKGYATNVLKIEKSGSTTKFYINDVVIDRKTISYNGIKAGIFWGNISGGDLKVHYFNMYHKNANHNQNNNVSNQNNNYNEYNNNVNEKYLHYNSDLNQPRIVEKR